MTTALIARGEFKGHVVDKVRTPFNQEFFIVDGDKKTAYWSKVDACRAIRGVPVRYEPVNIEGI